MIVQICIGSACHLKGSQKIVEKLRNAVSEHKLEDDVVLAGSFCTGKCNRDGVTIQINDDIHTGVTPENFDGFFKKNILNVVKEES
ncbi:MAG: (2Fe-2S) ferredoxin domain-containing protein [Oscillospiraceae bacterium]|nr:(2Fe-2S) ferredoxin domain-containing protein [Oscillospiraceae bacterium]